MSGRALVEGNSDETWLLWSRALGTITKGVERPLAVQRRCMR